MKKVFKPGDAVTVSGIYNVIHDARHKEQHQVTCVKNYRFPPCRGCDKKVRFVLDQAAVHIKDTKNIFLLENGRYTGRSVLAGN
jgi:hypothetical protein